MPKIVNREKICEVGMIYMYLSGMNDEYYNIHSQLIKKMPITAVMNGKETVKLPDDGAAKKGIRRRRKNA